MKAAALQGRKEMRKIFIGPNSLKMCFDEFSDNPPWQ
jgi:hypothetical protein